MRIRNAARLEVLADAAAELDRINPGIFPQVYVQVEGQAELSGAVLVAGEYVAVVTRHGDPAIARDFARVLVAPDHVELAAAGRDTKGTAAA